MGARTTIGMSKHALEEAIFTIACVAVSSASSITSPPPSPRRPFCFRFRFRARPSPSSSRCFLFSRRFFGRSGSSGSSLVISSISFTKIGAVLLLGKCCGAHCELSTPVREGSPKRSELGPEEAKKETASACAACACSCCVVKVRVAGRRERTVLLCVPGRSTTEGARFCRGEVL